MPVETVVLFSVDGMRPDAMAQADTPHIDRLIEAGAHTPCAQTVMPSVTLPCHTSMFRGVTPERHGITDNVWTPMARPVPSLFDLVAKAGRLAASFYSWEQLRDLASPGSLDVSFLLNYYTNADDCSVDCAVAQAAADYLARRRPALLFVYLGATDEIGHRHGWMSAEYLQAIAGADRAIGMVLDALGRQGAIDRTICLVQSDHGGHAKTHGTNLPEDMTIPWIIAGPGVRRSHRIAGPVHITDTAATIAHLLGIPPHRDWTGRVVTEALDEQAAAPRQADTGPPLR